MIKTKVKRILKDIEEINKNKHINNCVAYTNIEEFERTGDIKKLFEITFMIKDLKSTYFQGGEYIGKILLKDGYPFIAPNIIFYTQNGRFQVGQKICISGLTSYHPETWNPSISLNSLLIGVISTIDDYKIMGSYMMSRTPEQIKKFAINSSEYNKNNLSEKQQTLLKLYYE